MFLNDHLIDSSNLGWHICPESTCMKIIFIFALITGLVSYVAYSAALVSILSVKVVPIKSLHDIVSHKYSIYQDNQTINVKFVVEVYKTIPDPIFTVMMNTSRLNPFH
jgi:hypothetical protein